MRRVDFAELEWEQLRTGLRQKRMGPMRLVEHGPQCVEHEWCVRQHTGYLVSGELVVDFRDGERVRFAAGDGLCIPAGEAHAHRAHVDGATPALLFVVD